MKNRQANRPPEHPMDPNKLARHYLRAHGKDGHGRLTLRFWRHEWWQYKGTHYVKVGNDQFKPHVAKAIKHHIDTARLVVTQSGVAHTIATSASFSGSDRPAAHRLLHFGGIVRGTPTCLPLPA